MDQNLGNSMEKRSAPPSVAERGSQLVALLVDYSEHPKVEYWAGWTDKQWALQ